MNDKITVSEYLQIREDVATFLEEKRKNEVSEFDKLKDERHKKVVLDNAKLVYNKSKLIEPSISIDLNNLLNRVGGEFKSFNHRLKDLESLKRKIIADSKEYNGSYLRAAHNICDGVRYTIVFDDLEYVSKVDKFLSDLEDLGYLVVDFKNNWGKPFYQGFNVRICHPNGDDIFELQFHTPYGYQIKEGSTRDLYQVVRDSDTSSEVIELKKKANKLRKIFQQSVKVPVNALEYGFNHKAKSRR